VPSRRLRATERQQALLVTSGLGRRTFCGPIGSRPSAQTSSTGHVQPNRYNPKLCPSGPVVVARHGPRPCLTGRIHRLDCPQTPSSCLDRRPDCVTANQGSPILMSKRHLLLRGAPAAFRQHDRVGDNLRLQGPQRVIWQARPPVALRVHGDARRQRFGDRQAGLHASEARQYPSHRSLRLHTTPHQRAASPNQRTRHRGRPPSTPQPRSSIASNAGPRLIGRMGRMRSRSITGTPRAKMNTTVRESLERGAGVYIRRLLDCCPLR
jgi:hypothetical protein